MNKKVEWKEKKTSLGNAIIIGAVMAVIGGFVGTNWNNITRGLSPYFGGKVNNSSVDWSPLDEVYNKLAASYNGEVPISKVIDGAKEGMTEALGDNYTAYMNAEKSSDFYNDLHGNVGSGIGIEMGLRDG